MNKNNDLHRLVGDNVQDRELEIPVFPLGTNTESAQNPVEAMTLSLQDLLPDSKGEVVLEDSLGSLILMEGGEVTEQGILEESHVTHGGQDVSGMAYARFADGITLYYDSETTIEFI
ncbi:hypothetical protein ACFOW6_05610 [Fodinicurvata halophila]|uniref:Uncharacterized protein n=1 Tax=Fodinicurvata halophila TaxID=1419723 RepID=A0ABV8UJF8_9PROT